MSEFASVAKLLADDGMRTLPIACRLVPLDQWLVTHVDTSWKVKDIKQWILSKCNIWESSGAPQPPRFRPASPVTFSALSRRSSIESESWAGTEEGGGEDDWDDFAAIDYNAELRASDAALASSSAKSTVENAMYEHAVSTSSYYAPSQMAYRSSTEREIDATSAQYTLVSFSNGFVLEDDADLSWYKPRPFELFEVHRAGAIVSLSRNGILYAEPYFESSVRVSERPHYGKRSGQTPEDHQAYSLEWKPRWAIIRDGVLHLCKEAHAPPTHRFPLPALSALHGPEQFGWERSSYPRVICAKFNRTSRSGAVINEDFDDPSISSPQGKKKPKTGSWVILDMPNRSSYENLLRVLHRTAPYPLSSSFVPVKSSATPPTSVASRHGSRSSVILSSPTDSERSFDSSASAFFGVQYPEWRLALLQRCRMTGRGALGSALSLALAHCLYTNIGSYELYHRPLPRAPSISEGLRRRAEQASASAASEDDDAGRESDSSGVHPWKEALSDDGDDEEDDDVESEIEWEGWVRDLARRPTRPPPLSTSSTIFPTTSHAAGPAKAVSPSSPPSSDADLDYIEGGGTARARTLSCSPPHHLRPTSPQRARSSTISSAGTVFGSTYTYTSTTTTTITTYVDRVPDLRAPSSSTSPGTFTHHSYASPASSPPSLATSSPRSTPRARRVRNQTGSPVITGSPVQFTPPPNTSVPGSRAASVSGSEIGDYPGGSGNGRNTGIGGVRRIVRGVSIRGAFSTERFVRGLEDALDFVDGR